MFEKILVPLDGSRFSGKAIPYAVEIAKRFDAEIILLFVVRRIPPTNSVNPIGGGMVSPSTSELLIQSALESERENINQGKRYLRGKLRQILALGLKGSYRVIAGDPAEEIIDLCKVKSINLVIMTTSGKSGLKRALIGSVADRVIREPGFPVLAIRPLKHQPKINRNHKSE